MTLQSLCFHIIVIVCVCVCVCVSEVKPAFRDLAFDTKKTMNPHFGRNGHHIKAVTFTVREPFKIT